MKKTVESRRPFLGKVLAILVIAALVGAVVGCGTFVYRLTVTSAAGGVVTAPGEDTFEYTAGTVVDLEAIAEAGHRFVEWRGDVGTVADVNAASTTIVVDGDYSITANFVAVYDLSASSTAGGSVTTPGEGTFSHAAGTVVNLVATPASGYRFVNWTGDVGTITNRNAASTTITMNGDYSITANFVTIAYSLTISSTAGGSVTTPGEGTFTRDAGTVVSLLASPTSFYRFVNWTGNVGTVGDVEAFSTTITMNDNYSITANFEEMPPEETGLYRLQQWFVFHGYDIDVLNDELGIEKLSPGHVKVTVLDTEGEHEYDNPTGWYTSEDQTFLLFPGRPAAGDTVSFSTSESFGFFIDSDEGRFYTETELNPDGFKHALVYHNTKGPGYIIAFEDLWGGGDMDYTDRILEVIITSATTTALE